MPTAHAPNREEDLRRLLTEAIEVQLAALKAGITFWTEWIDQTSKFVQSATKTLSEIGEEKHHTRDTILELVDAGRESLRSMTEIPRHAASHFLSELDKLEKEQKKQTKSASAPDGSSSSPATRSRPKRASRVKV